MLHALTNQAPTQTAQTSASRLERRVPPKFVGRPVIGAQATYGNQAVLRMLRGESAETPRLESIQRKPSCAGGGSCAHCGGNSLSLSAGTTHELGPGEEDTDRYSDPGVVLMLEDPKPLPPGSGTCINGGGESGCHLKEGVYKMVRIKNTCCTKDCTIKHEQTHINDVTGWGCCKVASVAYNKKDADQTEVEARYKKWNDSIRTLTECNAHKVSVACADQMKKDKKCDGDGKDTDCCKDLDQYRENYASKIDTFCNAAPKEAPPCPAF
jgi:hypothetical protein